MEIYQFVYIMSNLKSSIFFLFVSIILFNESTNCFSQISENKEIENILKGAIDLHIHPAPDIIERSVTDFELADLAEKKGLKAIVIKNHVSSTAGRVELVNIRSEKIKIFGGIALNMAVGGINPDAVEAMCKMSPEYGKIVWFPTLDAAYYKQKLNQIDEGLTILKDNKISYQTIEVLKIIARENLIMATGHLSPEEIFLIVPEAKKHGVNKILITHAMAIAPGLSVDQMTELVKMGVVVELCYFSFLSGQDLRDESAGLTIEGMAAAIQQIGAKNFIISSDLGQAGNPLPPDGLGKFVKLLMEAGISRDEINLMIKTNPGRLLDIE